MRFVIVNLFIICLLLFGIGYLAFGNVETIPKPVMDTHVPVHPLDRSNFCLVDKIMQPFETQVTSLQSMDSKRFGR